MVVTYAFLKFTHILGVVLLIGNVSVTSIWKVFADRTRSPVVVFFAQRLVIYTDWSLTVGGVLLTVVGGYGMAWKGRMPLLEAPWLFWSQALFLVSGAIWVLVLIPLQTVQSRQAALFAATGSVPEYYYRLARWWIAWGVLATVPLIGALYVMVSKTIPWATTAD